MLNLLNISAIGNKLRQLIWQAENENWNHEKLNFGLDDECSFSSKENNKATIQHEFLLSIKSQWLPINNKTTEDWVEHGLLRRYSGKSICLPMKEMQEIWVWSLGQEDTLVEEMATRSSILPWKIPWTEEL